LVLSACQLPDPEIGLRLATTGGAPDWKHRDAKVVGRIPLRGMSQKPLAIAPYSTWSVVNCGA